MSFVQNGSFEAFAQTTGNVNNSTESNPFGLKDFSRLLDAKFGNSAFSSNLLETPKGNIQTTNPFDNKAMDKIVTQAQRTGRGKNVPTNTSSLFGSINNTDMADSTSVFTSSGGSSGGGNKFGGFNKGTGMATGGRVKHKLDFCY